MTPTRSLSSAVARFLAEASPPIPAERRHDLALAAAAAGRGGRAALGLYGREGIEVSEKAENDPVTAADHASNREVLASLHSARPGDPILSEESVAGPANARARAPGDRPRAAGPPARLWIVDPLDGTKEFLAGNGEFAVMVGLAEEGRAVLGAVYQPAADLLYVGLPDAGAWAVAGAQQIREPDRLRAAGTPGEELRLARSRSHPDAALERLTKSLGRVEVVRSGSVGIKCALVASGGADLYVHPVPHLKEWDTCAPEAVLRGAGGRVSDCSGRPLRYGKPDPRQPRGIVAAVPDAWPMALAALRTAVPELSLRESG
ncbi:MAG: 3'(2'),5'-bisphosphate nucleotidase CysQ [Gemmatimonadota bacterium]